MSGTIRSPPIVVTGSADSATVTTFHGCPVNRPVRNSTVRCPISQSANVSYTATYAVLIDSMLSSRQHDVNS